MAEEEKEAGAVAEEKAEEKTEESSEFGGDDLMDLFEDESEFTDETLALLTSTLDDIDMGDLMEQVREIQDIMDQRRGG